MEGLLKRVLKEITQEEITQEKDTTTAP